MEQIQAFFGAHPFVHLAIIELVALIGMFVHFLKLNIKSETALGVKKYFLNHFKNTLLAILTTLVAAFGVWYTGGDIQTAFLAGYTFDSMLNKA